MKTGEIRIRGLKLRIQHRDDKDDKRGRKGMWHKTTTKKGIALLLIGCMTASGVVFTYANQSGTDAAVLLMASMGVLSMDASGKVQLSDTVSRGEFAKMLVLASPYKDLVASGVYSSPFKDVPAGHALAPYIKVAATKGLLSGYSDGSFRPDVDITLEQAVSSTLNLLGYTQSDFRGAFPYAQMNTYVSIGLSKNISGGIGSVLTKQKEANLLYNLMGTTM